MNENYRSKQDHTIGLIEWFRIGEYEQVDKVLADMQQLGVTELRTGVSWADWHTPYGNEWYQWLFPHLAREVNILPCILYTPPSLGIAPKSSAPPRNPRDYADFIDVLITQYGRYFEWIELWNEPNNLTEWDWTLDPYWFIFAEMVGGAAYWSRERGKKTVLGGMSPIDPNWLQMMFERGVLAHIDAVGVHGFPGVWEHTWEGWAAGLDKLKQLLDQHGSMAEIWITEAGFSTWQHDEYGQLEAFVEALEAPADRLYWYSVHDLDPDLPTVEGFHLDEREYHFGLKRADGTPKLLFQTWANKGLAGVQETLELGAPAPAMRRQKRDVVLITGGAGFVGTNLAHRLLSSGQPVLIYDNLSRPGVEQNLRWLCDQHGDLVQVEIGDVRNRFMLKNAVRQAKQVFHLAAQVAVTTSLQSPEQDFAVNAYGTLNLLEAIRSMSDPPPLVFTSTNKVYGALEDLSLYSNGTRYKPVDCYVDSHGINEDRLLDFHSPYGCSKGTADQYILDYARMFGLPTVVFRMSCIYGPHQFGTEDQGWVAHFLIQALDNRPITLYGDGKQVRDVLFVEDLVNAFLLAQKKMDTLKGEAFNIGGGVRNTTSLLELIDLIEDLHGQVPPIRFDRWRPGDQRYYVSDTRKFQQLTGWQPQVAPAEGVEKLYQWLLESRQMPAFIRLAAMEVAP